MSLSYFFAADFAAAISPHFGPTTNSMIVSPERFRSYFGPTADCLLTFVTTLLSCMYCARTRLDEPSTADASMRRRGTSKVTMRMRLSIFAR
jgi:hypothetical protein